MSQAASSATRAEPAPGAPGAHQPQPRQPQSAGPGPGRRRRPDATDASATDASATDPGTSRAAPPADLDPEDLAVPAPVAQAAAPAEPDAVCAAAVDLARAAAVEEGGDTVGEHLGVAAEPGADGDAVVTHSFATTQAGYRGWRWAVTVARAAGTDVVTVDEVVLLPGSGALLAPPWVPWSERLQPGDLGPGDLLPPPDDDPRLVPWYADVDAEPLPFDLHRELGLGRARVLSREGRDDAAERWLAGPGGPDTPIARAAPGRCVDCGFLVPLAGALGDLFGVCANAVAPDDGRVVALLHGCGAYSETVTTAAHANTTALAVEHEELELVDVGASREPADGAQDS